MEDVILVPVTSELATDAHKLLLLSLLMMEYPYRELGATRVLVHGKKRYEDLEMDVRATATKVKIAGAREKIVYVILDRTYTARRVFLTLTHCLTR